MNEPESPTAPEPGGPESFEDLLRQIPRLGDSVSAYFQAHLKKFGLSLKQDLLKTVFWIFAVILLFQVTYLALSLLVHGAGEGLGGLLGNRIWLGNVVAGAGLLLLLLVSAKLGLMALNRSLRKSVRGPAVVERQIQQTLGAMQEDFKGIFQVKAWVERYPLPATGAVAVLGFWVGGNLVHAAPREVPTTVGAEVGAEAGGSLWIDSFANVLMATFSDVIKDAAHLWLQQNLKAPDAECPPPAP